MKMIALLSQGFLFKGCNLTMQLGGKLASDNNVLC